MKKLYFARFINEVCFIADENPDKWAVVALEETIAQKCRIPAAVKLVEIHSVRQLPTAWLGVFPQFDTCERTCQRFLEGQ